MDPQPCPADAVPCRTCGVAVPGDPTEHRELIPTTSRYPDGRLPHNPRTHRQGFARCNDCAEHRALAGAIATAHPGLGQRIGGGHAVDRLEAALVALAVLGKPAPADLPPPEVGRMIRFLAPEGERIRWIAHAADAPGHVLPEPFAHLTTADRNAVTVAWGALLADRRNADAPPVRLAPPALSRDDLAGGVQPVSGGCMLCGVATVEVPARALRRAGGAAAAAADVWSLRPKCDPHQIGGRMSPNDVRGHTCPDCTAALDHVGCIGPSAIERALVVVLGLDRHWSEFSAMGRVPAWGALVDDAQRRGKPTPAPNETPWAHLGDLSAVRHRVALDLGVSA